MWESENAKQPLLLLGEKVLPLKLRFKHLLGCVIWLQSVEFYIEQRMLQITENPGN